MRAVILSAGRGSRLGAATGDRPKALVEVHGRTLLSRQVTALRAAGVDEVAVVTGWRSDAFDGVELQRFHNERWATTTMVESLAAARDWLTEDTLLVSYGDIVYGADTIRTLAAGPAVLAISYDPDWLRQWSRRFADPLSDAETFRLRPDGSVAEIGARAGSVAEIEGQYVGLLRFTPQGWAAAERALAAADPADRPRIDFTALLSRIIDRNEVRIDAVPVAGPWFEFDSPGDLEAGRETIEQLDRDDAPALFVMGIGGPSPRQLIDSTAVASRITWLYNPEELGNPGRDVPLMQACRGAVPYRTTDEAVAAAVAINESDPIGGVLTFSESAVTTVSLIAEKLGLRGNPVPVAHRLTDKHAQRSALAAAGVPTQPFARIDTAGDLPAAVAAVGFPAVLKPAHGGGSRLVTRVDNEIALYVAWDAAERFLAGAEGGSDLRLLTREDRPFFVLEGLLRGVRPRPGGLGDYFSVESAVYGGEVEHLAVIDRWPLAEGFRETGGFLPAALPDDIMGAARDLASAAIAALGFTDGITHIEMKWTLEGPRVIEVNGRIGGPVGPMIQLASGYDYVAQAVRAAIGAGPMTRPVPRRYAGLVTPCLDGSLSRREVAVEIDEDFARRPGVAALYPHRMDHFDIALGGGYVCQAYLTAGGRAKLSDLRDHLYQAIHVRVDGAEATPAPLDYVPGGDHT